MGRVLARISAEVTQPFPDRKFDGIFTITTELSPMASPAFEVGRYVTNFTRVATLPKFYSILTETKSPDKQTKKPSSPAYLKKPSAAQMP